MTNPYEPPKTALSGRPVDIQSRRHILAGAWLSVAGVFDFVAIILLSANRTLASFNWSAVFLIALGLLVLFDFRLAIVVTRLIGWMTIAWLALFVVLVVAGSGEAGEILFGSPSIEDPISWQAWAVLSVIALTTLPPWWALRHTASNRP